MGYIFSGMEEYVQERQAADVKLFYAQQKVSAVAAGLDTLPTTHLVELFEETSKQPVMTIEVSDVRGWIMDALKRRNKKAFWAWVDSTDNSPRKFYLN